MMPIFICKKGMQHRKSGETISHFIFSVWCTAAACNFEPHLAAFFWTILLPPPDDRATCKGGSKTTAQYDLNLSTNLNQSVPFKRSDWEYRFQSVSKPREEVFQLHLRVCLVDSPLIFFLWPWFCDLSIKKGTRGLKKKKLDLNSICWIMATLRCDTINMKGHIG